MKWLALVVMLASSPALANDYGARSVRCAPHQLDRFIVSSNDIELTDGGGVVVGLRTEVENPLDGSFYSATEPGPLRFRDGKSNHEATITDIAPGLMLFQPPSAAGSELALVDSKKDLVKVKRLATAPPTLPTPQIVRVRRSDTKRRYANAIKLVADLRKAAPEQARAVIVYGITKAGTKAHSWTLLDPETKSVTLFESQHCRRQPDDMIMSAVGDRIALAWVDDYGRVSKLSKPVTIVRSR